MSETAQTHPAGAGVRPLDQRERDAARWRDDATGKAESEDTSLSTSVSMLLEEARMLIPGSQTLFGFQLVAVFQSAFRQELSSTERNLHLLAMGLTVLAIALLMAPAAYHRQRESESVSRRFLRLATVLIALGTLPLAAAICLETYIVATAVTHEQTVALAMAGFAAIAFAALWYLLPRLVTSAKA